MSRGQGLLVRIGEGLGRGLFSSHLDKAELAASIQHNLERMLNIRQGSLPHLPDFGLPDFNDLVFQFPDALVRLVRAVEQYLIRYEPRLERVEVSVQQPQPDPLTLGLRIRAQYRAPGADSCRMVFLTLLTGFGQADIQWLQESSE